jgi:SRSO17 transposase
LEGKIMERRFEERKRAMLAECEVAPEVFSGMQRRLRAFAAPFIGCLRRREQKEHAQTYLSGLLSDLKRKNTESIAYRHDQDRRGLQHFMGESAWDHQPFLMELARQVGEDIGEPDGVIVFDPSGFQKKGTESVGVARQWLGRLGKVDNGQVAVYMGYASRKEHALVNERLFLPRKWAQDKRRRKKCGVPKELRFKTRHELAFEMLEEQEQFLPHTWVAGDVEMGRSTAFRKGLRARGKQYLLGIPSNSSVRELDTPPPPYGGRGARPKQPFQNVTRWRESLPRSAWVRVDVRDGEKGPLAVEMVKTRVQTRTERKLGAVTEELLVVMRFQDENRKTKYAYYLSNAHPDTPYEELARVAKAEHRIEDCIKRNKSETGLADYEVRTWHGWHHHQTLSLIAAWFLNQEMRRGKKTDACDHSAPDSQGPRNAAA